MLNLFADGELDSGLHSSLFGKMSESPELQQEMSELIAIRESVKNDSEAFTPPPDAKSAIMARIGLTDSHKVAPLPIAGKVGGAALFFSRMRIPLVSAAIGSLITLWIVSSGGDDAANDSAAKIPVVSSFNTSELTVDAPKENFAVIITPTEISAENLADASGKQILAAIPVNDDQDQLIVDNNTETSSVSAQIRISDFAVEPNSVPNILIASISFAPMPFGGERYESANDMFAGNGIGMTIRMSGVSSFSAGEIAANDVSLQNGMNIGMYLPATSNLLIGIEFGNEQFSQPFTEKIQGFEIAHIKSPDVFWAAVSAHYTFDSDMMLNGRIRPFVQAAVGGSESGMIWKCVSGLQYNVHGRIGASLGIEYGGLGYTPAQAFITSHKIGLAYGMYYKI